MSTPTPPRPPFDPELATVLHAVQGMNPVLSDDTLEQIRQLNAKGVPGTELPDLTVGGAVLVEDLTIPGPDGAPDLTLLVMRPATGTGPWPAIYYAHGGGMVMGTRRSQVDAYLRYITEVGAVVVSVEYRLAPETPRPSTRGRLLRRPDVDSQQRHVVVDQPGPNRHRGRQRGRRAGGSGRAYSP